MIHRVALIFYGTKIITYKTGKKKTGEKKFFLKKPKLSSEHKTRVRG